MDELQSNKVAKRWRLTSILLAVLLIAVVVGGFLYAKTTIDTLSKDTDSLKKENAQLQEELSKKEIETPQSTKIDDTKATTVYTSTQGDSVTVTMPVQNTPVTSPLTVSGAAPGTWFHEGQLTVKLVDSNNQTVTSGVIMTQETASKTDPVAFSGVLNWNSKQTGKGFIIIEKENPSGLAENADSVKVPIVF